MDFDHHRGRFKKTKSKNTIFSKLDWRKFSPGPVVGVDEVGRGCLAGPVFAAAVLLKSDELSDRFTDSKLLSPVHRKEISLGIWQHHVAALGEASPEEIDEINILQASLLAMKRAVKALEKILGESAGHLLIDGREIIPHMGGVRQTAIIKGDLRVAPISAASIIAKVARDELMLNLDGTYPSYGFKDHKGYPSEFHKQQIEKFGISPLHRRSFKGVKEFC